MSQATEYVATSVEGPSRKRRRTLDEHYMEADVAEASLSEPATRDTKYYMDSGDCIILVEETLFKV